MRKTNLNELWETLPNKVTLIFVTKDGRTIPATGYEPVRGIGGGYIAGKPAYDIYAYREGWGSNTVRVNKFDIIEIQHRKRDYEYWVFKDGGK